MGAFDAKAAMAIHNEATKMERERCLRFLELYWNTGNDTDWEAIEQAIADGLTFEEFTALGKHGA